MCVIAYLNAFMREYHSAYIWFGVG